MLMYLYDWNELMKVIDKIGQIPHPKWDDITCRVTIRNDATTVDWGDSTIGSDMTMRNWNSEMCMLERTYDVCLRFINSLRHYNATAVNIE